MKIVIVGGGTSGWIVTNYLSRNHQCINVSTEEIPIIGVGEGTTGKFSEMLGLDPLVLMKEANALPKLGIKFDNWGTSKQSFWSPIDGTPLVDNYIDYTTLSFGPVGLNISLMKNNKTNFYLNEAKELSLVGENAWHIDAYKTAKFFKSTSNDVTHYESKVVKTNRDKGSIVSVELDNGLTLTADLFIDCSGFSRVLSDNNTWIDYSEYLPVNRAVTYRTKEDTPINSYTIARAMKYGWSWEIPTKEKVGKGYVYCDKYASEDDVLNELGDVEKIKSIEFTSGRVKKFLDRNCLFLGLSSGFLEPLQATSIHLTLVQLENFIHGFPTPDLLGDEDLEKDYNNRMGQLHDSMRDFVSVHYSGGKKDTDFWSDMKLTPFVDKIISLTKKRLTRSFDFPPMIGGVGQSMWSPTLWGLGHYSDSPIQETFDSTGNCMNYWRSYGSQYSIDPNSFLSCQDILTLSE